MIDTFQNWVVEILLLSDIHADEVITRSETAWNEEYNFEIFQKRLKSLEKKIISKQLRVKAQWLVIIYNWDFISWNIHQELYENKEAWSIELQYKLAAVLTKFENNISPYFKKV